jgi:hypothetical protein
MSDERVVVMLSGDWFSVSLRMRSFLNTDDVVVDAAASAWPTGMTETEGFGSVITLVPLGEAYTYRGVLEDGPLDVPELLLFAGLFAQVCAGGGAAPCCCCKKEPEYCAKPMFVGVGMEREGGRIDPRSGKCCENDLGAPCAEAVEARTGPPCIICMVGGPV